MKFTLRHLDFSYSLLSYEFQAYAPNEFNLMIHREQLDDSLEITEFE